jgi:hypothetical protein
VPVDVPDVDVGVETGRRPAQTHLYASDVLALIKLQVTNVIGVNTPDKVVVLLLLLSYSLG